MDEKQKVKERRAIVFDGDKWHVRHIRIIEYDLDRDEKVYHCDQPLGNDYATLGDVPEVAAYGRKCRREERRKTLEECLRACRYAGTLAYADREISDLLTELDREEAVQPKEGEPRGR